MIGALYPLLAPLLGRIDPERAHALAVAALERLRLPAAAPDDPRLAVTAFGCRFPNPVGLAAGFDKDGRVFGRLPALGFGFVEIGGVTPLPQPGNPRPRVFRLREDGAIINRYGLNSAGAEAMAARLAGRTPGAVVGINLGANKDSADRTADYVALVRRLGPLADFVTLNVSSPNTPGLRDLQGREALDALIGRVMAARPARAGGGEIPVLLKIAPDISLEMLDDIAAAALSGGVAALIVANTTIARAPDLRSAAKGEAGGLSGRPLFGPSTRLLAQAALRLEGRLPLVGVGGIDRPEAALAKIEAGASLLQLYTGLVFEGPALVGRIKRALVERMAAEGLPGLAPLVGRTAREIAAAGP